MPSFKQPSSLREASIRCVSNLIQTSCVRFKERTHCHEQQYINAEKLQTYLVSILRPLLDDICNYTFVNGDPLILRGVGYLLLATFMHTHMKELHYIYDPTRCKSSFGMDIGLWEKYLHKVPNLIELDLSGVGHEIKGILQILGNSCLRLEVICFMGYQVSENELLYLGTIRTLREIRNYHSDSLYLTRAGNDLPCIRTLLQLLPLLQYIHCCCIGDVLVDLTHLEALALRSCCEVQPTTEKIQAITRLCPKLVRLELGDPFINQDVLDFRCLSESKLEVTSLKLVDFSFTADLSDYLVQKGKYLRVLELVNFNDINLDKIILIGKYCKGLEVLKIYLDPDCRRLCQNANNPTKNKYNEYRVNGNMFENLLQFELEMYADEQNDETKMLMCLAEAKEVQSITFRRQTHDDRLNPDQLETILRALIMKNPMNQLKELVLLGPFKLSMETIQYFYKLPYIKKLTLYIVYTQAVDMYLKAIDKEIECNNIDLKLLIWLSSRQ